MKSPSVFISYRRVSSAMLATLMAKELEAQGLGVFVDTRRLDGGGPFPRRLLDAIDQCDVFLCLLAHDTLASDWVQNEIAHAHARSKIMIPVFQESYLPTPTNEKPHLDALLQSDGIHILDVKNEMIDETIERIAQMIKSTAPRRRTRRVSISVFVAALLVVFGLVGFWMLRPTLFAAAPILTPSQTPTATSTPTPTPTTTLMPSRTPLPTATAELLPSLTPALFDTAVTRGRVVVVSVNFVWLRREPNVNSGQLALVGRGEAVQLVGDWQLENAHNQIWWKVRHRGVEGWVEQQSLNETIPTATTRPQIFSAPTVSGGGGGSINPTSIPATVPQCNFNAVCDGGESAFNCPSDCGVIIPPTDPPPMCDYDAVCDPGESFFTCPSDC